MVFSSLLASCWEPEVNAEMEARGDSVVLVPRKEEEEMPGDHCAMLVGCRLVVGDEKSSESELSEVNSGDPDRSAF